MISERTCALCGGATLGSRKGGIAPYTLLLSHLRHLGIKLKAPESDYLHVRCALQANTILKRRES